MKAPFLTSLAVLLIGIGIGFMTRTYFMGQAGEADSELRGIKGYSYINPLLECNIGPEYLSQNPLVPFKDRIQNVIDSEKSLGNITYSAIYFRDLNNGIGIGINDNDMFRPASLLKVPLMLNILKLEEKTPGFLATQVKYDGANLGLNQYFKPAKQLELGKTYTLEEILNYMIIYSDNKATATLLKLVNENRLDELFNLLGVETPKDNTGQDNFITIKQYATFFRLLFNASYLSYDLSEKALSILAQADFKDGLRVGVPISIPVAHKFGETTNSTDNYKQLHDCGIVYYPKKPYLLCISVRGQDFDKMKKSIQKISRSVYDQVDAQVKGN